MIAHLLVAYKFKVRSDGDATQSQIVHVEMVKPLLSGCCM